MFPLPALGIDLFIDPNLILDDVFAVYDLLVHKQKYVGAQVEVFILAGRTDHHD